MGRLAPVCMNQYQMYMVLAEADFWHCAVTAHESHREALDHQFLEVLEAPLSQLARRVC